jgi:Protein of unknown function (DUF1549)/Protein of unknown function (DUF1553)
MAHASVQGPRLRRLPALAAGLLAAAGLVAVLHRPTLARDPEKTEPARAAEPAKAPPAQPVSANTAEMVKVINEKLAAAWKENSVTPSRPCTDHEFIRRASLDIIGRIAKPEEIEAYFKEPEQTRRGRLIERLLASDEYARHWANMWTNWLLTRSGAFGRGKYHDETRDWLVEQFKSGTGYDKIVHALLTASGKNSDEKNGAVNFILAHVGMPNPQAREREEGEFDMVPVTSRTTRLFLGVQTQCTQCHDHPFDKKLLQHHFWGINAYFRQVQRVGKPPDVAGQRMVAEGPALELKDNPDWDADALVYYETRSGKELQTKATFLDGRKLSSRDESTKEPISGLDRRRELADRILEYPTFPKAYVNRVWAHFFGRGFTNPIDDFTDQNEPTNPELFNTLAENFKHYGYNQRDLIRWICNSNAYQLSCVANKSNEKPDAEPLFSRMLLKAMSPETLFDSLMVATRAGGDMDKLETDKKEAVKDLRNRFLDSLIANFGDDEGNEVVFNATVVQALLMMNSNEINELIAPKEMPKSREEMVKAGTVVVAVAKHKGNHQAILRDLYLASLNRPPTQKELDRINHAWGGVRDTNALAPYHDLFWALLNSNEFILNH